MLQKKILQREKKNVDACVAVDRVHTHTHTANMCSGSRGNMLPVQSVTASTPLMQLRS